ncbi:hypothetical protein PG988_012755 [Apiospora saccharicola]
MPAGWTPRAEKRAGTEDSDLGYGNNACGWDKCSREGDTYGVYPDGPPHMEKWGSGPEQDPKKIRAAKLNANLRRRRKELDGYRKHFEKEREALSLYCGHTIGGLNHDKSRLKRGWSREEETALGGDEYGGYLIDALEANPLQSDEPVVGSLRLQQQLLRVSASPTRFSRPSTPWAESTNLTLPSLGLPSKYGEASIRSQLTLRKHEAKADIRSPTEDSSAPILTYKPLGEDVAAEDARCVQRAGT